jgi:glycine/D-amino acid oxidase-like deaminating enzyme
VVHNYGHGGSGWSLSWGSGTVALDLALAGRDPSLTDIAVIGCGALGLTAAILAQRAGARSVTIYAKDLPAATRSFNATGSWTPFSRVALRSAATPAFESQWQQMARTSWRYYQSFLNLPGDPVEFTPRYHLSDVPPPVFEQQFIDNDPIGFVYYRDLIPEINSPFEDLSPGAHPFPLRWCRRRNDMMFNITAYAQHLTDEFQSHGGLIVTREFHSPSDFAALSQPVILHCTGYAARQLFGDLSLTPVRGQIAWLPPQPEASYGVYFDNLGILARRDGIVVQLQSEGEASGWNDPSEEPSLTEAQTALRMLQSLQARMKPTL